MTTELTLTDSQHHELTAISQSRSLPAGYVFRARLILMLAEGFSFRAIQHKLQTTAPTIIRWKERFIADGIDGAGYVSSGPAGYCADASFAR